MSPRATPAADRVVALLNDHLHGGGTERVLSYLSRGLLCEQGPLFVFDDAQPAFDYGGTLVPLGVSAPPYASGVDETRALLEACVRLRSARRRYRVDVCISQKEGPNLVNLLSGFPKSVVTVHEHKSTGVRFRGARLRLFRQAIRALYNRADLVVAVSQGIADDLQRHFGVESARLRVVYNPCDADAIAAFAAEPVDERLERLLGGPTLVTVGRLVTQKGQWHLIRALARVRRRIDDVRLLILGTGDHLEYLQCVAAQSGVADCVHFLGYDENPFRIVARADAFVLSSLWEGFPACLQEAMACGTPVVACDCPSGPRELLAPALAIDEACDSTIFAEHGILVPRLDTRYPSAGEPLSASEIDLADALVRLLDDAASRHRYRAAGLARVRAFGIERYLAQWRDCLDSL